MPIEAWDRSIKLDLYGTFLGSRFGIPELKKSGGGSIINMSSVMNFLGEMRGFPARHSYSAAKGGVSALSRCIAAEYAKDNIRCNAIAPCFVQTGRNVEVKSGWTNEKTDTVLQQHPMGLGEPSDIAHTALYLFIPILPDDRVSRPWRSGRTVYGFRGPVKTSRRCRQRIGQPAEPCAVQTAN